MSLIDREMENILGFPVAEIGNATSLTLPEFVFQHASNAIEGTSLDYRERGAEYGFRNGYLVAKRAVVGTEFNLRKRKATVETMAFWRQLFGGPALIDFHTHPCLSVDYFKSKGRDRINIGLGFMQAEDYVKSLQLSCKFFSEGDLSNLECHDKLIRSMLLGTERGYLWIINPGVNIPIFKRRNQAKKYKAQWKECIQEEARQSVVDHNYQLHAENIDNQGRLLTEQFCNAYGFAAFINDDYNNPVLTRLNVNL